MLETRALTITWSPNIVNSARMYQRDLLLTFTKYQPHAILYTTSRCPRVCYSLFYRTPTRGHRELPGYSALAVTLCTDPSSVTGPYHITPLLRDLPVSDASKCVTKWTLGGIET